MITTAFLFSALIQSADATEITVNSRGHASNPVWSTDGKKLAFELNEYSGKIDLFTVNMQGDQPSSIPKQVKLNVGSSAFGRSGGVVTGAPVWHSRGMLFFEGSYSGGSNRIYMTTFRGPSREYIKSGQLTGDLSWPSLSADGKALVFVSDATGSGDVYRYDIQTQNLSLQVKSKFSEMAPSYDDFGRLAYTRKRGSGEDLFVLEGKKSSGWAGGNGDQTRPVWANNSLVFFSNERGTEVWDVVVTDGPNNKKFLARSVRLPFRASPALSPDKKWVAYGLEDSTKSGKIWFSRLDGKKTVSLDTGLVACGEPNLTERDGKIILAYTALPAEGSDWRQLHVRDVTSLLR